MIKNRLKSVLSIVLAAVMFLSVFVTQASAADKFLFCDLDLNGVVNASDARKALRFSVNLEYFTVGHLKLCDLEEDGGFSAANARYILRLAVKLESTDKTTVSINGEDFLVYVNNPQVDELFRWDPPAEPVIKAAPGTFTFTVYGYGHGVGLSQYGSISLDEAGYTYDRILKHYYTGIEIKDMVNFPKTTVYPTLMYDASAGKEVYKWIEHPTEELLARIVYQEIYGVTGNGKNVEALKVQTICIFTNLAYYGFYVNSRWDVGIASSKKYEELPEKLRTIVKEVVGKYMTVQGKTQPVLAVYSASAAGMTASADNIWGQYYSHLVSVPSPFDMKRSNFISTYTCTKDEMYRMIKAYDTSIVLSDNPAEWLRITEHTGSIDERRGYVVQIKVGNKQLSGYNQFHMKLMGNVLRSSCFTITYTP